VAKLAADRGEVPLTALCVHKDGTIGLGYMRAPKSVDVDPTADVDELAADHRLLCYQKSAVDLPADGGKPTLTPKVSEAPRKTPSAAPSGGQPVPQALHRRSATGECGLCD
jgi:hypothetical protein